MIDFWEWKIYENPSSAFETKDRVYLGDYDIWQAVLAFRDWEFRIYTYIYDGNEDEIENNFEWLYNVFEHFSGSYECGSFGYVTIDINDENEIVEAINKSCQEQLDYYSVFAKDSVAPFVKEHMWEMKKRVKVYNYYK